MDPVPIGRWPASRRVIAKRANVTLANVQKLVSSGKRRIRGLASSVRPDRVGDVVEPKGGSWKLPVPMLWQHSHKDPVGWVRSIEVRSDGLWIEAEFAEGFERADEVWRMVEAGLISSFSIGFRALKSEPLSGGGLRFTKWELLEISVVVVPANADAKISRGTAAGNVAGHPGAVRIRKLPSVNVYANPVPGHDGAVLIASKKASSAIKGHPGAVRLRKGSVRLIRRGR